MKNTNFQNINSFYISNLGFFCDFSSESMDEYCKLFGRLFLHTSILIITHVQVLRLNHRGLLKIM